MLLGVRYFLLPQKKLEVGKQGKENEEGPQMLTDSDLIGAAYLHLAHASVSKLIEAVQHQIRTYSLPLDQRRQLRRRIQAQVAAATPASTDECWRIFLWEKMKQKRHTALI
jgi:hypothetical protein